MAQLVEDGSSARPREDQEVSVRTDWARCKKQGDLRVSRELQKLLLLHKEGNILPQHRLDIEEGLRLFGFTF